MFNINSILFITQLNKFTFHPLFPSSWLQNDKLILNKSSEVKRSFLTPTVCGVHYAGNPCRKKYPRICFAWSYDRQNLSWDMFGREVLCRGYTGIRGSHPLPGQLYGEHTGPHHILCSIPSVTAAFSAATHTYTHSW